MKVWWLIASLAFATPAMADISVTATVDSRRIAYGESFTYTITVAGTQAGVQPSLPLVDGLTFQGPSTQTSFSFVNGQTSQSVTLTYAVTPTRTGQFTIPATVVNVGGKAYSTQPIAVTVEKGAVQEELKDALFGRIALDQSRVYLGQTVPANVYLLARQDVPLKGVSGFQCEAPGLGFKYLPNIKQGTKVINGQSYNIIAIEGAISPTQTGTLSFGPCVIRCQLAVEKRGRSGRGPFGDSMFDQFFGTTEIRETPVTVDALNVEVLALPEQGRPAGFAGAVGQWNLDVNAKPTEVAVGDPITLTIRITGKGNIDTVPTPKLTGLDDFKTYDPTTKTTKNDLATEGEREFQQVLIAKSTDVKQLPAVSLVYFDPVTEKYQVVTRDPIPLVVKAGTAGASAVLSSLPGTRPAETLGQDIVYIKEDFGPRANAKPLCATPTFWAFNVVPVFSLLGFAVWKRRADRLQGDVAYARRSRAGRRARKLLATATTHEQIQQALQSYLGDRLNIPASGITGSVVEEHKLPVTVAEIFQTCDAVRFAGAQTDLAALKRNVEQVIDELETASL